MKIKSIKKGEYGTMSSTKGTGCTNRKAEADGIAVTLNTKEIICGSVFISAEQLADMGYFYAEEKKGI